MIFIIKYINIYIKKISNDQYFIYKKVIFHNGINKLKILNFLLIFRTFVL